MGSKGGWAWCYGGGKESSFSQLVFKSPCKASCLSSMMICIVSISWVMANIAPSRGGECWINEVKDDVVSMSYDMTTHLPWGWGHNSLAPLEREGGGRREEGGELTVDS
ncbi:hypothetical protein VNO78_24741 [Psophocarpus tetragonolobus]|uniref:Uncharacterized protein n=1 Tax=Psophocarpus tetragonolobus TaxID=3891 RepID=A0AAN9S693_PSOTE